MPLFLRKRRAKAHEGQGAEKTSAGAAITAGAGEKGLLENPGNGEQRHEKEQKT